MAAQGKAHVTVDAPVLRDIHLPSAAWWPLAPGWWLLAVTALLLVASGVWLARRHVRRGPLRAAMREVDLLERDFSRNGDTAMLAAGASRLLRRVAMRVEPACAAAPGDAWRAFLDTHAGDASTAQELDILVTAPFRNQPSLDASALLDAVRACCRRALRRGRHPRVPRRLPIPAIGKPGKRRTASGGEHVPPVASEDAP